MYLNEVANLVALLIEADGTQSNLSKASSAWIVTLEASEDDHVWSLRINGVEVPVLASMVKRTLKRNGLR